MTDIEDGKADRRVSPEGKARQIEVGRQNLAGWRSRARTRANDLQAEVDAYRDRLIWDAGESPSATRVGLLEGCVTTYAGILKVRYALVNSRKSDLADLAERASWLGSNLLRLLKALNLDTRPKPKCLADIVARNVEEDRLNQGRKPLILKESAPKEPELGGKAS